MVKRKTPRQRARITEEQVHEMMRLQRQGQSIQSIARAMGCHRQTVRMHLKEKEGDILRRGQKADDDRGHPRAFQRVG